MMNWPVRIVSVEGHERLDVHLRHLLLDMADRLPDAVTYAPGKPSFFVNKWRSSNELFRFPDPVIGKLVGLIESQATRWNWPTNTTHAPLSITSMWAIVAQKGMYGRPHRHQGAVSGVYYVDEGDDVGAMSGAFVALTSHPPAERLISPRAGRLMMFRSDMYHGVLRYNGTRPRIAISFNLTARP
jgi:hypothetical protein